MWRAAEVGGVDDQWHQEDRDRGVSIARGGSAWVAEVSLEMRGLPMLKNARKKTGYNWFEGETVEEGNAENTDDDEGNDYNEMEDLVDDVLGNDNNEDDDDYNTVAEDDINSKDGSSGKVDSNSNEESVQGRGRGDSDNNGVILI